MRFYFASRTRPGILFLLLAAGACAASADDLSPELIQLARFKQKVRQDIERLANCTCLETMERSARAPGSDAFQFMDRVRLEVTHAGGKELLAWPGGARFQDPDQAAFVRGGLVVGGMFVSQARNVFASDQSTFQYVGPEDLHGRQAVRYDFRIPSLAGLYKLGSGNNSAWVASKGSFWFDAGSLALIRLEVAADAIPPGLGLTSSVTRIEYAQMHMASSDFLAPQTVETVLTHASGDARRNIIRFAKCRAYTADSSISFDGQGPPGSEAAHEEEARVDLPAGLTIRMELEDSLDWATAAVGDPVQAHVTDDVRQGGRVVLPKGTIASGRVRRMERRMKAGGFLLGIELTELRWGKNRAEFHAILREAQTVAQVKSARAKSGDAGNIVGLAGSSISSEAPSVEPAVIRKRGVANTPGLCTLWMKEEQWHVPAGMKMVWRT
jgi:hypothetical protein